MSQLLSSFGKQGNNLGLLTRKVDIEDTDHLSKYFVLAEYTPVFSAGKNPVAFNGSNLLKGGSEVQIECYDSQGNSLFIEQAKATNQQFSDISRFVVSIHVYDEVYNGPGKLVFVGTTKKNEVVRWIGNITIDKTLTNASKVRFYNTPTIEVRPLLYPVVDTNKATDVYPPPTYTVPIAEAEVISYVYRIVVTSQGGGWSTAPFITLLGGDFTGQAQASPIMDAEQRVIGVNVTKVGSGYKSAPSVIFTGPGSQSAAYAILSSSISKINIEYGGTGYSSAPAVTITSNGGGVNAAAYSTITSEGIVDNIYLTNRGTGYVYPPNLTFTAPVKPDAAVINVPVLFSGEFHAYAVTPPKDTDRFSVDKKRMGIDYRLILNDVPDNLQPSLSPTTSFNSQMEGKTLEFTTEIIQLPASYQQRSVVVTGSFVIKKILDSKTAILSDAFYYPYGKTEFITNIVKGTCHVSYDFIKYNTSQESALTYQTSPTETPSLVKKSYVEVTYRNIEPFCGYVARHKLYRKSLFHPGDYELISDEPLKAVELLTDVITYNKAYETMGKFYHEFHLSKYWFSSSNDFTLNAKCFPIDSMQIGTDPSLMDGTRYVLTKVDSIAGNNDNIYRPYNAEEYNRLSGSAYNSNFISLKANSLYQLSFDLQIEKELHDSATVAFFFTSSIADIKHEKTYDVTYGMKIGEISTSDITKKKYFEQTQTIFFTPQADYYGTLVIVPYQGNPILSNISLKVYNDYGFSPEVLFINIPFPINVKNEPFEIKAELYDINHNIIYSDLKTTHIFDTTGNSLIGGSNLNQYIGVGSSTTNQNVVVIGGDTIINGNVDMPNLMPCDITPHRFVAWHPVTNDPEITGRLCYTSVSNIFIDDNDYISISIMNGNIETTVKSLAIRYDGDLNEGRRIYVNPITGVKTYWP